ncbi:helix-turn-helix domain-containing protein [Blautia producta]|nr:MULTISPECIES: helix-turn-helix domain-containing protein [Blautia]MCQ4746065.1 helix-turn-helix domain-containing protein [Blautia producta]
MAINMVMKHYEGYIAKLATRKMYDDCLIWRYKKERRR